MTEALEQLVDSLLWEGYALYPYTPTATKNATPTPFGIVYPPVYAATLASTYDHLELRCVLAAPPDAVLGAEIRFLAPGGERHQAVERRIELPGAMVGALARVPARKQASVACGGGAPPLAVDVTLEAREMGPREYEVILRVSNRHARLERARSRGSASPVTALDAPDRPRDGRPIRVAARAPVPERQHVPGPCQPRR